MTKVAEKELGWKETHPWPAAERSWTIQPENLYRFGEFSRQITRKRVQKYKRMLRDPWISEIMSRGDWWQRRFKNFVLPRGQLQPWPIKKKQHNLHNDWQCQKYTQKESAHFKQFAPHPIRIHLCSYLYHKLDSSQRRRKKFQQRPIAYPNLIALEKSPKQAQRSEKGKGPMLHSLCLFSHCLQDN